MTVDELITGIAHQLQDPDLAIINQTQVIKFINEAAHDASNEGWYLKMDDTALAYTADTFEYTIPADFVHIYEIRTADGGDLTVVPLSHWTIEDGVTPVLRFSAELYENLTASLELKGHKRPKLNYTQGMGTIDTGMESFLRERATAYGARNIARGSSGRAANYRQLEQEAWLRSESLLEDQQDLFTLKPGSRRVYGR